MNDPHFSLTPEIQQKILNLIYFGAFPELAAEAAGIPVKVFHRWLRYGEAKRPVPLYRNFLLAVRKAQAETRITAEHEALHNRPLDWLKNGPGKETARMPGWSSPVKPATPSKRRGGLSAQRAQELITILLQALTPFPEARVAAAEALSKGGWITDGPEDPPQSQETQAQPNDIPAPPVQEVPVAAVVPSASAADRPADPGFTLPNVKQPEAPPLPVMETKCFDVAPVPPGLAGCPPLFVKAAPMRNEAAVNPKRTCSEGAVNMQRSDRQGSAKASTEGVPRTQRPPQTGPGPWDSLDAGHWIVFSSS